MADFTPFQSPQIDAAYAEGQNNIQSQDADQEYLQEQGYPPPEARPAGALPPGGGRDLVPHYVTFSSILNYVTRTYRWTYDAARKHSDTNALAIRNDTDIMESLRARQMPTAQLAWHIEPRNPAVQAELDAAATITSVVKRIPRFQQYRLHLLEAIWFGRYGVANNYSWDYSESGSPVYNSGPGMSGIAQLPSRRLIVRSYRPVNGDKLVFKFSGQPGILVHQQYEGTWQITDRGRAHFLTADEREQLIVHEHEPEDVDFFQGELAGGIHGVGCRGRVYWLWWLKTQVLGWLMDYLERVGAGGFTIYFYEHGNPKSLGEVRDAAETQALNNFVLFPRYKEGGTGGPGIERVEPSNAGAELLKHLVSDYFDVHIRRYIVGMNIASERDDKMTIGEGSNAQDLSTFGQRIKFDAENLDATLSAQLLPVLYKYNCPSVPPGLFVSEVEKPNAGQLLDAAEKFYNMGGSVDEDELRGVLGLRAPEPGHNVLSNIPPLAPVGYGTAAAGVPGLDPAGPMGGATAQGAQSGGHQEVPKLFAGDRRGLARVRLASGDPRVASDPGTRPELSGATQTGVSKSNILGPDEEVRADAQFFRPHTQPPSRSVSPAFGAGVASAYEQMEHRPSDPKVARAYKAFVRETAAQWNHLRSRGYKFEPWRGAGQPYANSREMIQDVRANRHLFYFPTEAGFGQGDAVAGHPMGQEIEPGVPANDAFRAVHDVFGHAKEGHGFGPSGEDNAFRSHAAMYSPEAIPALASETRGQNSWVNFGPHGEENRRDPAHTTYAQQKAGLLPEWAYADVLPTHKAQLARPHEHGLAPFRFPGGAESQGAGELAGLLTPRNQFLALEKGGQTHIRRLRQYLNATPDERARPDVEGNNLADAVVNHGYVRMEPLSPTTLDVELHHSRLESARRWIKRFAPQRLRNIKFNVYGDDAMQPPRQLDDHVGGNEQPEMFAMELEEGFQPDKKFERELYGSPDPTTGRRAFEAQWTKNIGEGHQVHLHVNYGKSPNSTDDVHIVEFSHQPSRGRLPTVGDIDTMVNEGSMKPLTGKAAKYNPFAVLAAGRNLLNAWVAERQPPNIVFKGYGRARTALYDQWTKDVARTHGYVVQRQGDEYQGTWRMRRKAVRQKFASGLFEDVVSPSAPNFEEMVRTRQSPTKVYSPSQLTQLPEVTTTATPKLHLTATPTRGDLSAEPDYGNASHWVHAHELASVNHKQLQAVYDNLPPVEEYEALAKAGRTQRYWYDKAAMVHHNLFPHGHDATTFSALSAAMSNATTPTFQLRKALRAWRRWEGAGRPRAPQKVLGVLHMTPGVMYASVRNAAWALLHHATSENQFPQQAVIKIPNYARNQAGDDDVTTNDTWMLRHANLPDNLVDDPTVQAAISAKLRATSRKLRRDEGEGFVPWSPKQVQAAVWNVVRPLGMKWYHSPNEKSATSLRKLTHQQVHDAGDLSTALDDPEVRHHLEHMHLAEGAQAVKRQLAHFPEPKKSLLNKSVEEDLNYDLKPFARRLKRRVLSGKPPKGARKSKSEEAADLIPYARPRQAVSDSRGRQSAQQTDTGPLATDEPQSHWLAFSPNVDTLTIDTALQRFRSSNQAAFHKIAEDNAHNAGFDPAQVKTLDAIGDWDYPGSSGAENSVLQALYGSHDPEQVKYLAAWHGLTGHQQAVMTFQSDPQGRDAAYQMLVPEKNTKALRSRLSQYGIPGRTLVPTATGHLVVIADRGRALRNNVGHFARSYNATVDEAVGTISEVGNSESRQAARAAYRDIIDKRERGVSAGQSAAAPDSAG